MPMRRIVGILIAIAVLGALPGSVAAARPEPRVTIIVGPSGDLTDLYRSVGADAAREARRWTSDVVSVVSPNATWPVVKRALRGASIVVYLGHGNGFPSPYRDRLYPPTQDGLGLNPVAGGDDTTHQYFGEAFLAREIRLAPGAVVLLHHLCYASGNSEPGLPEGSLGVGQQRVDNYAAGWLRAGAGAVIADTFGAPEPYLRGLLGGDAAVDRLWRDAPSAHDHVLTFPSTRTPGHQVAMDPTRAQSGFNRSIVWRPGLTASEVRAGAGQVAKGSIGPISSTGSTTDSLASLGITFRAPGLAAAGASPSGLVAGGRATLTLPIKVPKDTALPAILKLGLRWDPVALDTPAEPPVAAPAPATPATTTTTDGPTGAPATSSPPPSAGPAGSPAAPSRRRPATTPTSPAAPPDATATEPPAVEAVAPEVAGSVVTPTKAKLTKGRLRVTVQLPSAAGTYRLVTTVHGPDGVAFDATTQALIPALSVRVSSALSAAYGVVPALDVVAGTVVALPVRVVNDGAQTWGVRPSAADLSEELIDPSVARQHPRARLVARWVPLAIDGADTPTASEASVAAQPDPGSEITVALTLTAPTAPGQYLLLLDVASPLRGSLAASGVATGLVRVTVQPASGVEVSPAAP